MSRAVLGDLRVRLGLRLVSVLAFAAGGAAVESLFLVGHIPSWVVAFAGAVAALYGGTAIGARRPVLTLIVASLPTAVVVLWVLFSQTEFDLAPMHALIGALAMAPVLVLIFFVPVRLAHRAWNEPSHDAWDHGFLAVALWLGIVAGTSAIVSVSVSGAGRGGLTSTSQGVALSLAALTAAVALVRYVGRLRFPVEQVSLQRALRRRAALAGALLLIDGTGAAMLLQMSLAHLRPLTGIAEVTMAGRHVCVRHRDGDVLCWGARDDGTDAGQTSPLPIDGLHDAVQIDADGDATCALRRSGEVVCWDGVSPRERSLSAIPGLPPVRRIALGGGRGCALTRSDEIACWSRDRTRWSKVPVGTNTGVTDILAESWGGCWLGTDGVACWGRSDGDQTAEGAVPACLRSLEGKDGALLLAGSLVWGLHSVCAVTREGAVRCFGTPAHAPFGPPHCRDASDLPRIAGVQRAVSLSFYEVCGIDMSGSIRCWDGEGRGGDVVLTDVVNASSSSAMCAVRSDGTVWCWGLNHHGQLGDGTRRARRIPTLVRR